jgi:hypothetical protein
MSAAERGCVTLTSRVLGPMLLRLLVLTSLLGGLVAAETSTAGGARTALRNRNATGTRSLRADTVRVRADSVREYLGLYETGFEVSWFHACDAERGDDTWWVTLTNDALRQRDSLTKTLSGRPRALFVRWRGTVSPKMPMGAGHMARGSRYMLVSEIVSLRASDDKGCTSA